MVARWVAHKYSKSFIFVTDPSPFRREIVTVQILTVTGTGENKFKRILLIIKKNENGHGKILDDHYKKRPMER